MSNDKNIESIKSKILKLHALAESGNTHEAQNARAMLERCIGKKKRPEYSEARNDIHSLGGCYGLRGSDLCHTVGVFLQSKGVHPLPKMNAQYKIIRGQYRNEFVKYLKTLKSNIDGGPKK